MIVENKYQVCDETFILQQIDELDDVVQEWFQTNDLDFDKLHTNIGLLSKVVERVDMRKDYYKVFHDDMKISEYKRSALTAYWICKLKPFWIDVSGEEDGLKVEIYSYINEYIAAGIIIGILIEFNNLALHLGKNLLSDYLYELLYSMRYRDLNKESYLLLLDPYYYLYHYSSVSGENDTPRL